MSELHALTPEHRRSLQPYVSDHALAILGSHPNGGWSEIDGTLAFVDVSGFTQLTERLARLGRVGAEHINDVLNTIFTGLITEVLRVGGDVLEFGGDAMVVLYDGPDHERRAVVATKRMFDFMARDGRLDTPIGTARLRMSCGMASGAQPYHLVGDTRRALMVAGPVSTEMARLEAAANAGEAYVNAALAAALPRSWFATARNGATKLRMSQIDADDLAVPSPRLPAADRAVLRLLPTQFHALTDVHHLAGELKQVAMAFIRLDGTDDLLAIDGVDGLHDRLRAISAIVDHAAAELDVCWLETQAEANSVRWTLISGAPTATERDGERLLRVLRRIAERTSLPLRIGANRGVVFVGDMGHPERCTYIVMGDATNLAARLMVRAHPGEIIAGERLHETCPRRFESTPLEPFVVKGKKLPVRAFVVGRDVDVDVHERLETTHGPLIGRDAELEALQRVVASGDTVDLVGEVGSGKTRLWQQVRDAEPLRTFLLMRSEPHEVDSPYLPVRRLIRTAAGIGNRDDPSSAGTSLSTFVKRTSKRLMPSLPLIADVIGATVAMTPAVAALDEAFRTDRLRAAVCDLILAIAGDDGVIIVEDVHWIDESSLGLLETLCASPSRRAAVIFTRRPGDAPPSAMTTISLEPLDDEHADALLLSELPVNLASDATLARLRAAADGNPLYLVELARVVANSPADGSAVANAAFPDTIERLLAARIDRLSLTGRALIRDASVLGMTINRELASRVLERLDLVGAQTWERELGDLVVVDDDSVRFRNELSRVAAYEGLSIRRRRAIHQRAGDVIEAWGETAPIADRAFALAFHASGSGIPERIVRWCTEAAEVAIDKGAMEIAESMLGSVVDAQRKLGSDGPTRSLALQRLAFAAERAGHAEVALDALGAAARLSSASERSRIAVDRARLLEKLGRYRAGLTLTARALQVCTDPDIADQLKMSRASIYNYRGRFRECLALCNDLLEHASGHHDRRLVAQAHLLAEWCCVMLGLPERADHERAALDILTDLDDSIGLANLLLNQGSSAWQESRVDDAIVALTKSAERYRRAGDVVGAALSDNNIAEILTLQGRLDEADWLLTNAQRVLEAANYPLGVVITTSGRSRIEAWRGKSGEAFRLQTDARDRFSELGADEYVVESLVRLVEIHVLAAEDAANAAERAVAEAREVLGAGDDVPILPATLTRLEARTRRLAGDIEGYRTLLRQALELATGDGFEYEMALASLAIGRLDNDDERVEAALASLDALGVLAPPPGY